MIEQGICIFSIVSYGIKSYFYAVSLYTCIYVPNVYIDVRRTVIVIYVLQSLYISYWMQTHIWSIELSMTNRVYLWCTSVWDCRVVMLETVMNSMENVFQLNKKNKPTYFLMTASFCLHGHSSSPRSKQAFSLSVRPAPAPLPCGNWYQNTLSRLCCLSARSDAQTSFSLSRPIPPFGVSGETGAEGGGLTHLSPLILF